MSSCSDIFSTRTPENPDGNNNGIFNETVEDLIINFETSLMALDSYRYESLFLNSTESEDSYKFISNASDIIQPGIFDDWGIDNERNFMTGLKSNSTLISEIDLLYDNTYDQGTESVELSIGYTMIITEGDTPYTVSGDFIFDLVKINSLFWYIRTWTDVSSAGNISFSSLKEPYAY